VAAELALLEHGGPVTILRPSKVHGEGAVRPREWLYVKRALDRRPTVLLAHRGEGGDHTTAAANIAALVATAAAKPGQRILNSADPDAPTGRDIARTIAQLLGHEWTEVLLDDDAPPGLGAHAWDRRPPIVLDLTAATDLGYQPVGDFAATVAEEVRWLAAIAPAGELPSTLDAEFFEGAFDYADEDAYLAERG
jgi:nucleoside-diphosphate-sugar epimerase